jgi:peptidyl-prolyl cis-trans isomerase B (cyclophilin B)
MMLQTLFMTAVLSAPTFAPEAATVEWDAPASFIQGGTSYDVTLEVQVGPEGGAIDAWALTPAAFVLNGKPLAKRAEGTLQLAPGTRLTLAIDLAPAIAAADGSGKDFELAYDEKYVKAEVRKIKARQGAPEGLVFMEVPEANLGKYHAVLSTNRGEIELAFWPETAPNHVRNFLDLCYTGFYDGVTFHRVIPGFMIQGGDPSGTGSGPGRRMLDSEFSNKKHVRGVLSMARVGGQPNSASSQFFVVQANSPNLDGQYSAFGEAVAGMDVVDKIVSVERDGANRPLDPQVIEKAWVVLKPAN